MKRVWLKTNSRSSANWFWPVWTNLPIELLTNHDFCLEIKMIALLALLGTAAVFAILNWIEYGRLD